MENARQDFFGKALLLFIQRANHRQHCDIAVHVGQRRAQVMRHGADKFRLVVAQIFVTGNIAQNQHAACYFALVVSNIRHTRRIGLPTLVLPLYTVAAFRFTLEYIDQRLRVDHLADGSANHCTGIQAKSALGRGIEQQNRFILIDHQYWVGAAVEDSG